MHISDYLFLGNAVTGIVGSSDSSIGSINNPSGRGVGPGGLTYNFIITPAASATNNLAASQALAGAGNVVLTAGAGVTQTTVRGVTAYRLDVPRAISITSTANLSAVNITVSGFDQYGQAMTETRAGPNITTANFQKAFAFITSITTSAAASNISAGTTNIFGFPFRVRDRGFLARIGWDNTTADNAATVVVADTNTATATTGDVRGTITPAGAAPNGSRILAVLLMLEGIQAGPFATTVGALGVTQA